MQAKAHRSTFTNIHTIRQNVQHRTPKNRHSIHIGANEKDYFGSLLECKRKNNIFQTDEEIKSHTFTIQRWCGSEVRQVV